MILIASMKTFKDSFLFWHRPDRGRWTGDFVVVLGQNGQNE